MVFKNVSFCSWNIHGYNSREIGIKLQVPDFLNSTKIFDFIGITETRMTNENIEHLCIPGFECIGFKNQKKNPKSNTSPGGIAVFVKPHLLDLFTLIKTKDENTIWIKIKKEASGRKPRYFYCNMLP